MPDPLELLGLAESLARDASALLAAAFGHTDDVSTKSSLTDMVSAADRVSERLIVEGIAAARPDDGVLGEEGSAVAGTSGVRWIVDPLDGTTNFLYGIPAYAVSIAVEVDGEVVAGVVADVSRGETFTATLGGGAFLDGAPIRCRDSSDLATALVGTGFSYDATRRAGQGAVVAQLLPAVRDVRRSGSAALDLCWLGAGRLDAYYEAGLAPWDRAAGALVAAEAGATVVQLPGDVTLAAPSALFETFVTLLTASSPDRNTEDTASSDPGR